MSVESLLGGVFMVVGVIGLLYGLGILGKPLAQEIIRIEEYDPQQHHFIIDNSRFRIKKEDAYEVLHTQLLPAKSKNPDGSFEGDGLYISIRAYLGYAEHQLTQQTKSSVTDSVKRPGSLSKERLEELKNIADDRLVITKFDPDKHCFYLDCCNDHAIQPAFAFAYIESDLKPLLTQEPDKVFEGDNYIITLDAYYQYAVHKMNSYNGNSVPTTRSTRRTKRLQS